MMNLHQAAACDYDLSSGDFRDDSSESTAPIARTVEGMPLCDIVFDSNSESSTLDVHRVSDIGLKHILSNESDEVDDDDAISSSSSSSSTGFYCVRVPVSPSTTMSDNDLVGDISIDSADSAACFHPLAQGIENKNEARTRHSPLLFASHIDDTFELSDPIEKCKRKGSYAMLRFTYLLVTLVIMLADGLQGKSQECVRALVPSIQRF